MLTALQLKFLQCLEIIGDVVQARKLAGVSDAVFLLWGDQVEGWEDLVEAARTTRLPPELVVQTTGQRMARATNIALERVLTILLDEKSAAPDVLRAAREIFSTSGLDDQAIAVNPTENFKSLALYLASSGHLLHIPPGLAIIDPEMKAKVDYLREVMEDVREDPVPTIQELVLQQKVAPLSEDAPGVQWAHVTWLQLADMLPTCRMRAMQRLCVLVLWLHYRRADEFGWFKVSMGVVAKATGQTGSTMRTNMLRMQHVGLLDGYLAGRTKMYRVLEPELVEMLISDDEACTEVYNKRVTVDVLRERLTTQRDHGVPLRLPGVEAHDRHHVLGRLESDSAVAAERSELKERVNVRGDESNA